MLWWKTHTTLKSQWLKTQRFISHRLQLSEVSGHWGYTATTSNLARERGIVFLEALLNQQFSAHQRWMEALPFRRHWPTQVTWCLPNTAGSRNVVCRVCLHGERTRTIWQQYRGLLHCIASIWHSTCLTHSRHSCVELTALFTLLLNLNLCKWC